MPAGQPSPQTIGICAEQKRYPWFCAVQARRLVRRAGRHRFGPELQRTSTLRGVETATVTMVIGGWVYAAGAVPLQVWLARR